MPQVRLIPLSFSYQSNAFTAYPNPDDYESKYAEDPFGEEMAPTARVWRVYLDEAQKADAELMAGWRDTTDVLLVFVCHSIHFNLLALIFL